MRAPTLTFFALVFVACNLPPSRPEQPADVTPPPPALRGVDAMLLGGFPVPPWQGVASPPAAGALPPKLVEMVPTLFEQGLADPRGCAYREIEIETGSVWGEPPPPSRWRPDRPKQADSWLKRRLRGLGRFSSRSTRKSWGGRDATVRTHGWVLPSREGGKAWAVAWNGLVYPIVGAGVGADLRADVDELAGLERGAHHEYTSRNGSDSANNYRRDRITPEEYNVSYQTPALLKVALLVRLGEPALAKEVWDVILLDRSFGRVTDPYLSFAEEWAWGLFDRAVTAHKRADHELALTTGLQLARVAAPIEIEADRRGFARGAGYDGRGAAHLDFLGQLPALVADEERRVALAPRADLPDAARLAALEPEERVRSLVEHLDEVKARQGGQPGGVALDEDPIVVALIDEGDAAVGPLIDALENDERLTRSVQFWRDFTDDRSLLGVRAAAYEALAAIFGERFSRKASTGDALGGTGVSRWRALAEAARERWGQSKASAGGPRPPPPEAWYEALADDQNPEAWPEAARLIAWPRGVEFSRHASWPKAVFSPPWRRPLVRGESLRDREAPSVGELLERRALDPRASAPSACELGRALDGWGGPVGEPFMKALLARVVAASDGSLDLGPCIAWLALGRKAAGHDEALDAYAAWVAGASPPRSYFDADALEPMALYPTRPSIVAASEALFRRREDWLPLSMAWGEPSVSRERGIVLGRGLVKLGALNDHALAALSDWRHLGALTFGEGGTYMVQDAWGGAKEAGSIDDTEVALKGAKQEVRVADWYAWRLAAGHVDAPSFELYWRRGRRDAALVEMRRWLEAQRAK
jgi:hypothetical protein